MSAQYRNDVVLSLTNSTTSATAVIDMALIDMLSLQSVYTDGTTGAFTFTRTSGNVFTATAHGQVTGSVGQCTTTGSLPTGLSTSTNYYVIALSANTFSLASSLVNALAGTAISISGAGTGTQTFTPTSISQVVKLQYSDDNVNWKDIPNSTVTVTGAGNTFWSSNASYTTSGVQTPTIDMAARYTQIVVTPTSGQLNLTVTASAKRNGPF